MRTSILLALAASSSLITASPIDKRATVVDYAIPEGGDVTILNYALTLEYLERKFYMEGLANYSAADFAAAGFPEPFYENLKEIYFDEETHVSFISGALTGAGYPAVLEATYSFPSTTAASFVALASVLEGVGVSAYLGAAAEIVNPGYLTAAGSILTVESRHSAYIRAALGESPFPKPFDTPLDFNQVFSLAAEFIVAFNPADTETGMLPFKAFPPLVVATSRYYFTAGSSSVTFQGAMKNALALGLVEKGEMVYAVFFSGLDTYYVQTYETEGNAGDLKIHMLPGADFSKPGELPPTGQVYVVLSTADGVTAKVSDENTISGVGIIEVSPPGDRDLYKE